ncbi:MAG TPA: hypothetical protein DHV86_00485 [Methylophilaceae bacterium]|jgi:hypothetical protein|nr:hypothetical protein [Methylophilaceae bacterium]
MNISKILKILLLFLTVLFFQLQFQGLKAEDTNNLDDEELPAIDPFAGGVGNANQGNTDSIGQVSQVGGLLNGMRLVGTILGENKKIAIFSSPDGGAFKFEESEAITDSTTLVEIFSEVVIVQDESKNEFEVYMNNVIKPSGG